MKDEWQSQTIQGHPVAPAGSGWECSVCTYQNSAAATACTMCGSNAAGPDQGGMPPPPPPPPPAAADTAWGQLGMSEAYYNSMMADQAAEDGELYDARDD